MRGTACASSPFDCSVDVLALRCSASSSFGPTSFEGLIAAFSVTPSRARRTAAGKEKDERARRGPRHKLFFAACLGRRWIIAIPQSAQLSQLVAGTGRACPSRRRRCRAFTKGKSPAAAAPCSFSPAAGAARSIIRSRNRSASQGTVRRHLSRVSPPSSTSTEERMPKLRSRRGRTSAVVSPTARPVEERSQGSQQAGRATIQAASAPALAKRLFCQRATRRASGSGRWVGSGEGDRPMSKPGVNRARRSMPATGGREGELPRVRTARSPRRSLEAPRRVEYGVQETQETQASPTTSWWFEGSTPASAVSLVLGPISPSLELGPFITSGTLERSSL